VDEVYNTTGLGAIFFFGPSQQSYGRFAWIYDLDGNKIELWQPLSAKP